MAWFDNLSVWFIEWINANGIIIGIIVIMFFLLRRYITLQKKTTNYDFIKAHREGEFRDMRFNKSDHKWLYRGSKLIGRILNEYTTKAKVKVLQTPQSELGNSDPEKRKRYVDKDIEVTKLVVRPRRLAIGKLGLWFGKEVFLIQTKLLTERNENLFMPYSIPLIRFGGSMISLYEPETLTSFVESEIFKTHFDST